jgi:hypothetical protein
MTSDQATSDETSTTPLRVLLKFVDDHAEAVKPNNTEGAIDVFFFGVLLKGNPDPVEFLKLIRAAKQGAFCELDPADGREHSYLDVGGWIGDQGQALRFMGLGAHLKLWRLMTPNSLPGLPDELKSLMAGQGMVSIVPMPKSQAELPAREDDSVGVDKPAVVPVELTIRLLAAANELLSSLYDSGSHGPDPKGDPAELREYPVDSNGSIWYHDTWELLQAARAVGSVIEARLDASLSGHTYPSPSLTAK